MAFTFVKRVGAPSGSITIEVGNQTFTIDDSANPTISVPDAATAGDLQRHPYLQFQGGSRPPFVPTRQISPVVADFQAPAFSITNPAVTPVLAATFTPKQDSVLFHVAPNFTVNEAAGCHVAIYLFVGPTNVGQLTPVKLSDLTGAWPNAQGVNKYRLGSVGDSGGRVGGGPYLVTGLTPGQQYSFELALDVIGYAAEIPVGSHAWSVGIASQGTPYPNNRTYWVVGCNNGAAVGYADRSAGRLADVLVSNVPWGGGNFVSGRVRVTPDGSRAVATEQFGVPIAIVTTGALDGSSPAVQRFNMPDSVNGKSFGVAIHPNGQTAYICGIGGTDSGKVYPVTLATGVFGTAIDLGQGAGGLGWDAVVDSSGTYLYVALHMTNAARVVRVKLSDGTITTLTLSTTTGSFAHSLALSPDGNTLYVGGATAAGTHRIWHVDLTGGAFTNQSSFAVTGVAPIEGIRVFRDGAGMIMAKSETGGVAAQGRVSNQIHHHFTNGQEYTTWINSLNDPALPPDSRAFDVAVSPFGSIYVGDQQHDKLNIWFGGNPWSAPNNDFWMNDVRVQILGAS